VKALTQEQIDGLTEGIKNNEPQKALAKRLKLGLSTVARWKRKMKKGDFPEDVGRKYKRNTRKLLLNTIKELLETNPTFFRRVLDVMAEE
jgi:transposase